MTGIERRAFVKGATLGEVAVTKSGTKIEVTSPAAILPFALEVEGKSYRVEKTVQTL